MSNETNCNEEEHKMHMCELKKCGIEQKDPEKLKEITKNPVYKCGNCGAETKQSENVCNPEAL